MKIRAKATRGNRYLGTKKGKFYILEVKDSPWRSSYTGNIFGVLRSVSILGGDRKIHTVSNEVGELGYTKYFSSAGSAINPNTKIL